MGVLNSLFQVALHLPSLWQGRYPQELVWFLRAPVTLFIVSSMWNMFLVCYFTWYSPICKHWDFFLQTPTSNECTPESIEFIPGGFRIEGNPLCPVSFCTDSDSASSEVIGGARRRGP